MRLIPGIDPDSHLQGGWQSASERLKMAAAPGHDSGSKQHHAAQSEETEPTTVNGTVCKGSPWLMPSTPSGRLDASTRHPLRLAAEASFSTHPPRAPGLHPHGEPTPCSSHGGGVACGVGMEFGMT